MAKRLVAGRHSVFEALKVRPGAVQSVFVSEALKTKKWKPEFESLLKKTSANVAVKKDSYFAKFGENTQGVMCEVSEDPPWPDVEGEKLFLLALDKVEDPHNLGAILRTAWLMGVDGVMVSDRDTAPLSATACKVACGGAEHVPVLRCQNLKNEIADLKQRGFWSYAMCLDSAAQNIKKVPSSEKTILVAGAEETGIRPSLIKDSDFKVYIPQKDPEASLNVSVSVGIGIWTLKES